MKKGGVRRVAEAADLLRASAAAVHVVPTSGPRSAGSLAREALQRGSDLIAVAGGDGTISEVADGLAFSHVPLAILPAGTANVLAHEARIPRGLRAAARQIQAYRAIRVPLGRIEGVNFPPRHFVLMAGAGFDARIIYRLEAPLKDRFGKLSYFIGGLRCLGQSLNEVDVAFADRRLRCTFALVTKVRNYGGDFEIAADVTLRDAEFEIVLFEGRNSWRYLRYLFGVATRRLSCTPGVCFARSGAVEMDPAGGQPVYMHADGELVGLLPARITMVPDALTLLLPPGVR